MPAPSRCGPKFICTAFTPTPFPTENRRIFEIRHRIALLSGIKELVENHGCLLPADGFEKRVGNGFMDAELIDHEGQSVTLEATGSDTIKIHKIVQACLYQSLAPKKAFGRVWISSINEQLECPPSLIRAINAKAHELLAFINEYPEVASKLHMPHQDTCPLCGNVECPHWKSNGGENHYIRKEVQTH